MVSFLDGAAGSLSAEQLQLLKSGITVRLVSRGQILQRKGDKSSKTFFVKSGCLRSYSVDDKGKEHIFMFAPEGWIISDMDASLFDRPADLYIDAIEDSEIEVLERDLFTAAAPSMQGMAKLAKRISVLQRRIIMLMSATLQERYLDFLDTYPDIAQRVPQKMIASYLGVTPEALSKVRGDMTKQK